MLQRVRLWTFGKLYAMYKYDTLSLQAEVSRLENIVEMYEYMNKERENV